MNNKIVIYSDKDGSVSIDLKLIDETLWLPLDKIASLFDRNKSTISRHISNIFNEAELTRDSTVAFFATVQNEGDRIVERRI